MNVVDDEWITGDNANSSAHPLKEAKLTVGTNDSIDLL